MTPSSAKQLHVLLVEDNLGDVRLTQEAFKELEIPHRMTVLGDGRAAMEFFSSSQISGNWDRPHIILLDLNLPKVSGLEVLRHLKGEEALKRIPVIVLSTTQEQKDIIKSYDLHANCFISKPIDLDSFIEVIASIRQFWVDKVTLPSN